MSDKTETVADDGFKIVNEPHSDSMYVSFGDQADNTLTVAVTREEEGEVVITVFDSYSNQEYNLILGQRGVIQTAEDELYN